MVKTNVDLYSSLFKRLSARMSDEDSIILLKKILRWYEEEGPKYLKKRLEDEISSTLQGWNENGE